MVSTLVIMGVSLYFGVSHIVISVLLLYNTIKKIIKRDWIGVRNYVIFLAMIYGASYLGINTIWVLVVFLLIALLKSKHRDNILKHPWLTYEYAYRQMEAAWSHLIMNSLPGDTVLTIKRVNTYSKQRIKEIEERGVKFEFLQNYYE